MVHVDEARAIAGRGLEGDRYHSKTGFYSNREGWGAEVTLIQSEAIDAVNVGYSTDFDASILRRNLLTSNVKLDLLIGRNFRCGTAILRGTKPFPPCARLAYLTGRREVLKYFAYCGGIGATVIRTGTISVGADLEVIDGAALDRQSTEQSNAPVRLAALRPAGDS